MALTPGSRLGPYEILAPLGAGGMGEVYRARDTKLDREVAIKVLPAATANDPAALARFEREAKAVAALSHPNILAIHDFGSADGVTFAVTELLQGETLRQRLDHGALPVRRAIEVGREIALGLAAAHERGIVHRDLKPENLFLTKDGLVKILDFGLARQTRSVDSAGGRTLTDHSESGSVVGTAGYMSPEQVRGEKVDHRSDIFSFGSVLYEMVSGKRAFKGDTSVETMNAILKEEPPAPSESGRPIPPSLERTVAHCLEKRPEDRFQSARDLAFDLGSLSAGTSASSGRGIPVRRRWLRKTMVLVAAAAAAALAFWAGLRAGPRAASAEPTFRRVTFRRGTIQSARFAPDGTTVVYGAAWEGRPYELFSVRTDTTESHPLGIPNAEVVSISAKGELAMILHRLGPFAPGTLARMPLGGGALREIAEPVVTASWAPNGEDMAICRDLPDGGGRLEFPIGKVLPGGGGCPTVSPDGNWVVVVGEGRPVALSAIDRKGTKRALVGDLERAPAGFAWSPDSTEVYFVGGRSSESQALRAVSLSGRERIVLPAVGSGLRLHDVATDGRFLIERGSRRMGMVCLQIREKRERDVSWLDGSYVRGLSADGSAFLFGERGDAAARNPEGGVYLGRCDGSPAIRLGPGEPYGLSPDGKWALTSTKAGKPDLVLLPTGAGSTRKLPLPFPPVFGGFFVGDGKRIAVPRLDEKGEEVMMTLVGVDDGRMQNLRAPDNTSFGFAFSPDGNSFAYVRTPRKPVVVSISDGGRPRELPGPPLKTNEGIFGWSADGNFLYVGWLQGLPAKVFRREIATGKTSPWLDLQPSDFIGVTEIYNLSITPDGGACVFNYDRTDASDLFVVDGLR